MAESQTSRTLVDRLQDAATINDMIEQRREAAKEITHLRAIIMDVRDTLNRPKPPSDRIADAKVFLEWFHE